MTLEYSTGRAFRPVGNWLLNFVATPDRLTVYLDLLALRAVRKEVSITTALWKWRGIEYQTVRSETHEDTQRMTIYAVVTQTDAERTAVALAAVDAVARRWEGTE